MTYAADNEGAAIYRRRPPAANAARPPGTWRDVRHHLPRGALRRPGRQDAGRARDGGVERRDRPQGRGAQPGRPPGACSGGADGGCAAPSDHGNKVRYRDIWIEPLS
ncbi:hypothetical protein LV779_08470 [Streptomyces thinghirensis]|nr:hypothetical protein [Streptomyces thinghirensis]